MDVLSVERVTVKRARLSLLVRVCPHAPRYTTPQIAEWLRGVRPTLVHHACVNDRGPTFGAVISHTSVPHVLEHLIIDNQVRDARSLTDATFVGTTEWLDEAAGLARVEVNFADDLVALQAMHDALSLLNGGMVRSSHDGTYHIRQDGGQDS